MDFNLYFTANNVMSQTKLSLTVVFLELESDHTHCTGRLLKDSSNKLESNVQISRRPSCARCLAENC